MDGLTLKKLSTPLSSQQWRVSVPHAQVLDPDFSLAKVNWKWFCSLTSWSSFRQALLSSTTSGWFSSEGHFLERLLELLPSIAPNSSPKLHPLSIEDHSAPCHSSCARLESSFLLLSVSSFLTEMNYYYIKMTSSVPNIGASSGHSPFCFA